MSSKMMLWYQRGKRVFLLVMVFCARPPTVARMYLRRQCQNKVNVFVVYWYA